MGLEWIKNVSNQLVYARISSPSKRFTSSKQLSIPAPKVGEFSPEFGTSSETSSSRDGILPAASISSDRRCLWTLAGKGLSRRVIDGVRHNKGLEIFVRTNAELGTSELDARFLLLNYSPTTTDILYMAIHRCSFPDQRRRNVSISSEESSPHVVDFSKVPSEYAYFLSVSFVTGMGLGVWGGICWEGKPRVFGFAVRPALLVLIGGMGRRPFGESSCGCAEM